ncbi:MAG TPA: SLC13 family permease, partial [Thermoproteota archaeon]|nr:SLC13 family permease [Thermoproteota archaeon]
YAPAVLVLATLFLIPAEGRQLLQFPEFVAGVDWNTIFMFGGSFVLGLGLTNSGAVDWLVNYIRTMGLTLGYSEVFAISAIVAFIVTYPASNTAAATVTVPVAVILSKASGLNPLPAVLAAAIASSISSALPSTTPPMAIVYGSGYVKTWDMFKVGMASDLVRLALLLLIGPPMAQALMSMKGLV